jgi:hypothetical protein
MTVVTMECSKAACWVRQLVAVKVEQMGRRMVVKKAEPMVVQLVV